MGEKFEYKVVSYDATNKPGDETVAAGVVKLLNANGAEGWDLFKFENAGDFVELWLKRRTQVD